MSKARRPEGDLFQRIVRQTTRSVRSAGPRYTPNVAAGAPNLVIEMVVSALAALSDARESKAERDKQTKSFAEAFRDLAHLSIAAEANETQGIDRFIALLRRSTTLPPWKAARTFGALREGLPAVLDLLLRLDGANPQSHDVSRDAPDAERSRAERNSSILREARSAYRSVEQFLDAPATVAFERGYLLLTGEWGTGKTHSVCDASVARLHDGLPTLLLLAKDFAGSSPLRQVLQSLDEPRFANLLSGLNALGREAGSRTLVIVDGINEGNREGWACKTLIRAASRFQWLGVVLTLSKSVRATHVQR